MEDEKEYKIEYETQDELVDGIKFKIKDEK